MASKSFFFALVLSITTVSALAACSSPPPLISPLKSPMASPVIPPTPGAAESAVKGAVMHADGTTPFDRIEVFFAAVTRQNGEGIYVVNTASSPWTVTSTDGAFKSFPMPPGEYVIVVGDPVGKNAVITDKSGKPKVWQTVAGQVLDVGTLKVTIP